MAESEVVAARLRTPQSAAIAGIIFALILGWVIWLLRTSVSQVVDAPQVWIADSTRRGSVSLALSLIPFAGIAFLWFIGVIRNRLGDKEDRLFATVFLGSGLLFVGTLFTAAAILGGVLSMFAEDRAPTEESLRLGGYMAVALIGAFGARMAAVFTMTVTTLGLHKGLIPKWLAVIGYVVPVGLFLSPPLTPWLQMLFPTWVLVFSIHILVVGEERGDPL